MARWMMGVAALLAFGTGGAATARGHHGDGHGLRMHGGRPRCRTMQVDGRRERVCQ